MFIIPVSRCLLPVSVFSRTCALPLCNAFRVITHTHTHARTHARTHAHTHTPTTHTHTHPTHTTHTPTHTHAHNHTHTHTHTHTNQRNTREECMVASQVCGQTGRTTSVCEIGFCLIIRHKADR